MIFQLDWFIFKLGMVFYHFIHRIFVNQFFYSFHMPDEGVESICFILCMRFPLTFWLWECNSFLSKRPKGRTVLCCKDKSYLGRRL